MRESNIEKYLRELVEARGGLCEKHVSPGRRGVPDRLITWAGTMDLVELKAPGKKPRTEQERDHVMRRRRGILVWVLDSKEAVEAYVNERMHIWPTQIGE